MINVVMISVASLLFVIAVAVPVLMLTGLIHSLRNKAK